LLLISFFFLSLALSHVQLSLPLLFFSLLLLCHCMCSVITALLTTLPKGRKSTLIMAGLVAFALFSAKSRHGPDDQG